MIVPVAMTSSVSHRGMVVPAGRLRHRDDGRHLGAFLAEGCRVLCPKCGRPGDVAYVPVESRRWRASFRCGGCALALESAPAYFYEQRRFATDAPWYGDYCARGARACGYCGGRWVRAQAQRVFDGRPLPTVLEAECPQCGRQQAVTVEWVRHPDAAAGREPLFGLPLALTESLGRARTLWAFNAAHLSELKRFVAATLRERSGAAGMSYFARLPAWLTSARMRPAVLKAIARLEQRAHTE